MVLALAAPMPSERGGSVEWRRSCSRTPTLLDPHAASLQGGVSVLVEGESIRDVSAKPIQAGNADVIDCKGRTLMPGVRPSPGTAIGSLR